MLKYIGFILRQINLLQCRTMILSMISINSYINTTFDFDKELCTDWNLSEISRAEYADNEQQDDRFNRSTFEPGGTKKTHLIREERDPYLAESRLDFDFTNTKQKCEAAWFRKSAAQQICKNETFPEEETKIYSDKILKADRDGDNLLFISIITNKTQLSILLIDLISHYSRLNVFNRLFQTALHLAALTENAKITRRLVIAGIDVEIRDRLGDTALHIACRQGSVDVVESLVTAVTYNETQLNTYKIPYQPIPQNLDLRNSEGLTCLHLAVINNHEKIVKMLLSKEANVNVIEMKAGKTCLHFASEYGSDKIVEIILSSSKPKLSTKTFAGYTATELAHYRGHDHIVYLLRCKGALAARPIETIETSGLEDDCNIKECSTIDINDFEDDYYTDNDYDSQDDGCMI